MLRTSLLVLGLLVVPRVAAAVPITWVDWTSSDATSVYGTAFVDGSTVSVTYTGERGFVQTTCGTDYWIAATATNPYTSAVVDNPPNADTDPARRCDIIALSSATAKTLTFSQAVTNPLYAVVSLNGNGYRFDRDFTILSTARGYWGDGTLSKRITTNPDGSVTYDLIGTGEPHGVIQFIGSFSTVSWTSLTNEYWNGFSIGFERLAVAVPPEIEVYAHGVELMSGQAIPVVVGAADVGTSTSVLVEIVNAGTGPLNIDAIDLSGANADAFAVGPFIRGLAANSTTTFELTFTASTALTYTASVTISTNDDDEPTFSFPIVGLARIDADGDGVLDGEDNCPNVDNPDQADLDMDGFGDLCDDDADGDGFTRDIDCEDLDASVAILATFYADGDLDGFGDPDDSIMACLLIAPPGYVGNDGDNCPADTNEDQADLDMDGLGDVCDDDVDGDGALSGADCNDRDADVQSLTTYYADDDDDGFGDPDAPESFCATVAPAGYTLEIPDNCVAIANADQLDADGDGLGDACDPGDITPNPDPDDPSNDNCSCNAATPSRSPVAVFWLVILVGLRFLRRRSA